MTSERWANQGKRRMPMDDFLPFTKSHRHRFSPVQGRWEDTGRASSSLLRDQCPALWLVFCILPTRLDRALNAVEPAYNTYINPKERPAAHTARLRVFVSFLFDNLELHPTL